MRFIVQRVQSALFAIVLLNSAEQVAAQSDNNGLSAGSATALDIFERRCLTCHNAVDRKGEFSLETAADVLDSGYVIAGTPEDSHLLSLLIGASAGERPKMPKNEEPLSETDVQVIREWIRAGANWPEGRTLQEPVVDDFDWWSLRPLSRPAIPSMEVSSASTAGRSVNPIDAFIRARQRELGLRPSSEADPRVLIRRLAFDLTGLPPSLTDTESFAADPSPHAYARLVDGYLASPQYGEHWARHWLDVVKYADTCGYDKDKLRANAWPYRDFVIRAFNEDKPYRQFVREQIAGDMLYPGTPDGILGLGFIAAGPWDFIGHVEVPESKIDGKVARNLDRDDMLSNVMNTFCSVTIQCARCHNHKFDPITQKHYYSLQSVFAAVDRAERPYDTDPNVEQQRAELKQQLADLKAESAALEEQIREDGGQELANLEKSSASLRALAAPKDQRDEFGFHSQIASSAETEKWVEVDLGRDCRISAIVLNPCHDDFAGIGSGFGFPVRFRLTAATTAQRQNARTDSDRATDVVLHDATTTDVPNPGLAPVVISLPTLNGRASVTARYIRLTATRLALRQNDFILALAEMQVLDANGQNTAVGVTVQALDSIEAPVRWRKNNLTDGVFVRPGNPTAAEQLAAANDRIAALRGRIETPERIAHRERLVADQKSAAAKLAALPRGRMVYAAATHFDPQGNFRPTMGIPRPVTVLHRGNETQPGEAVRPGRIPLSGDDAWEFELPEDNAEGQRRAALAEWITRNDNPLTWRSIANRIWQYHFGQAIADSPNDFGKMGLPPSHPQLLDWLATEFRDHEGSFKTLHRLIVTSDTYRQSSAHHESNAAIDGENRFLWRMNRRRLTAEEVRDAVLTVSGKLNPEMGGPGFYLFDLEKTEHSPHFEYDKFDPEDPKSHRRSVYRFVVRSQPDPFMTTLDCADSSQSTPRRIETLTSLQALSLLNSRFTLAMAKHFAARVERAARDAGIRDAVDGDASADQLSEQAFLLATGRLPDPAERTAIVEYAREYGLENLCRLLFNLNEFVFVE